MMKTQVQLSEAIGKVITQVVEGYNDLMIVFADDTFAFLHPARDYDDTTINEPDYLKDPSKWCIAIANVIAAGVLTQEEADEKKRQREAEWKAMQERTDREAYERLKTKFGNKE